MARRQPPDHPTQDTLKRPGTGPVAASWPARFLSLIRHLFDQRRPPRTIVYYHDTKGRLRACVGPHGTTEWHWDDTPDSPCYTIVTMTQN